jgi:NAD(P)-dependent dehydrogenase (short-subunit alcohol dehydrogenase family)
VREVHVAGCKSDLNQKGLNNELKDTIVYIKCDVSREDETKKAIDEIVKLLAQFMMLSCTGIVLYTPTLFFTIPLI